MKHSTRIITAVLALAAMFASLLSAACAPYAVVAQTSATELTPTAAPTVAPTASPVPPASLTYEQKKDMVWRKTDNVFGQIPARIFIFYIEHNGEGKLIWVEKEYNPGGGGFDLFDVFNGEFLFHVSIPIEEEAKVTPSDFPRYIDEVNEMLVHYDIVAAGKLLDISEIYLNNNVDSSKIGNPYEALISHFRKTPSGYAVSSKEELLDAFIDATPAQYILPVWEYILYAPIPNSYFNPPSPSPVITPVPDNYKDQMLPMLGVDKDFKDFYSFAQIDLYYYEFNGLKRIIWVVSYYGSPEGTVDMHSLFNGEYLFSFYLDPVNRPESLPTSDVWQYHSASSPTLKGIKLLGSGGLSDIIWNYREWGISYQGNELLDQVQYDSWYDFEAFSADMNMVLSRDELIDLYLELTPRDYIPPYWEYVPGAEIPDVFE